MTVSRRQALTLANMVHENEGFSVYVDDAGDLGGGGVRKVSDSLMVGGQAPGESHDAPIRPQAIRAYAASRPELQQPAHAMGAWYDTKRHPKPQIDLDVAKAYPRTTEGHREARADTLSKDEMAYGELDAEGEYAGTHNNPFSTRVMGRHAGNEADYTTRAAARARGEHFRTGITSEAMLNLMAGNRPAAKQAWVRGQDTE